MDISGIGRNLRRLRLDRALTQQEIAEMVGISRATYQKFEAGSSDPKPEILQDLAVAFDVKLVDLLTRPKELKHIRFRAFKKMRSRENILIEVGKWLDDYNYLETLLCQKLPYPFADFQNSIPEDLADLERAKYAACLAREKFGLSEKDPIRDIAGLIDDNGIKLYPLRLTADGFFGLSVSELDGGPAIIVNVWERISVERWIFSAAHELGHLLLHLDSYDTSESVEDRDQENEANVFASYFLMPEEAFLSEWRETSGLDLVERVLKIKSIFNVSYKTVLYRISEYIGSSIWPRFNKAYVKKKGASLKGSDEPEAMDPSNFRCDPATLHSQELEPISPRYFMEDRLSRLVRLAVEEEIISLSRAAEILGYNLIKMRDIASSWV